MIAPNEKTRFFGIYHTKWDGHPRNLAMSLWHWGKFYEKLIRTIMDGTWKYDDDRSAIKAINYWWGIEEEVVENNSDQVLTPERIVNMDWLAENVIGTVPEGRELDL